MDADFSDFYEQVAPDAQRLAIALTGSNHDANDLTQAVFERIFARWRRLQINDPTAYVRSAVVREHISERRRPFRKRERSMGSSEDLPVRPLDVEENEAADDAMLVIQMLRKLPKRQCHAVVLRYLLDQSIAQTAVIMGSTEGTVKRLAHDGLQHLEAAENHVTWKGRL